MGLPKSGFAGPDFSIESEGAAIVSSKNEIFDRGIFPISLYNILPDMRQLLH